jgi:hypothetical protein
MYLKGKSRLGTYTLEEAFLRIFRKIPGIEPPTFSFEFNYPEG